MSSVGQIRAFEKSLPVDEALIQEVGGLVRFVAYTIDYLELTHTIGI